MNEFLKKTHWQVIAFCGLCRERQRDQGWKAKKKKSDVERRKPTVTSKCRCRGGSYSEVRGKESHNRFWGDQKETSLVTEIPCRRNAFYLWRGKLMSKGTLHPKEHR